MLAARPIEIAGPLEDGVLLFRKMTVREELGRPFEFELDLVSEDGRLRFEDVLGQRLTVRLALPGGKRRYFDGFVSRFAQEGRSGRYATYQATVRPWLWFLTRTADCRIFQGKTVPEIVKEVFREHGFTDFEEVLSGTYRTREYCVQYRETDFNFVSRLLEQEGIYYYFKHEEGKHSLVLADSYSAHDLIPGYEEIPYYPPSAVAAREDHIHGWSLTQEVQPGAYALNTFDFEKPRASLAVKATFPRQHTASDYEVYDYPGEYLETGDGDTYARVRVEELQAGHEQASGQGDPRGLAVGGLFALTGYPREDQNREYLVISAVHRLELDVYESGKQGAGPVYSCHFRAIESKQPYHAARLTSKPVVQGPQTAIVVGKAGEEIWTDQYGRVKVQFHWDRLGKRDENSSCWVRVAQVWAGKSWGGIHIPRLGQEVIVEFLEGDPDRPIITGRVYNADQMPPYELPANATRSGLLSRSTKGGGPANFNEIRFEDKKGEEELYIHAEKDRTVVVEADERHDVGGNRTRGVGGDEAVTVGGARTKRVGASETVTIAADHSESVGGSETRTVAASQTETVGAGVTRTVGASLNDTIGASVTLSVGGAYTTTVAAEHSTKLGAFSEIVGGAKSSITAGAVLDVTAGMKKEVMAGVKIESTGGVKIENFAGMRISLAAGGFIEKGPFKKIHNDSHEIESGTVIIKAGSITLKGPVTIKGDLTVKGNFSNPSVDSKK